MEFDRDAISTADHLRQLPMVQDEKGIWQNKWHRHDVYDHTVEVVSILQRELKAPTDMIVAGWLHDVGKRPMRLVKYRDGHPDRDSANQETYHSFKGHEAVGEAIVRSLPKDIFDRLGANQEHVAEIVGAHFLPMDYVEKMKDELKAGTLTFASFGEHVAELLEKLTELDQLTETEIKKEEILDIFYADKKSQESKDLEFLCALREHLMRVGGGGDIRKLYELFLSAYRK